MNNTTNYNPNSNDQMVAFEGCNYSVLTPWSATEGGKTYLAKGVEEGATPVDGMLPAVELEAFKTGDGLWDVISVCGPELKDETGGVYGMLLWSEREGFVVR